MDLSAALYQHLSRDWNKCQADIKEISCADSPAKRHSMYSFLTLLHRTPAVRERGCTSMDTIDASATTVGG